VFLRIAGSENHLPAIPRRAQPWAIWLADLPSMTEGTFKSDTIQARELWHSGKELNDSLPPFASESLKFADGGKIIFCSEQDGRNHLYMISTQGGQPILMTAGKFDVEDVELTPDKTAVLYTSNQNDEDRRHIFKIPLGASEIVNGKPIGVNVPITHGPTIEWHPLMLADGKTIVCLGSSGTSPAMPYKIVEKGRERIASSALPKDFPLAELVEPEQVVFRSEDGFEIHGQLFVPRNRTAAKLVPPAPALIFVHGGPPRQMLLGFHYMYYYHNSYAENQYLASLGYVVLSVNYRLSVMYGRAFRAPDNAGWKGASEYKDVVAGGKYLQSLPYVDRKRIGIWGGSYGGFLTAMALARNSDIFSAGVDFHGVHDWSALIAGRVPEDSPDYKEALKLAFDSSPVASVASWKSPVLLIHGDDDRNVPFGQTVDLAQRLRRQNVEFEQLIFPDEIHDLLLWKSWVAGYRAGAEFFNKKLGVR
jgi:dipeptidyl aminopeptidase/acylaminoacyl peptidase